MSTPSEELRALKEELSLFDDWEERYGYIISLGRKMPPFPEDKKNDVTKVRGCVSNVWIVGRKDGNRITFLADSDAALVKGLLAALHRIYNDKKAKDVLALSPEEALATLEFTEYLTPGRQNGFYAAVKRIQGFCEADVS